MNLLYRFALAISSVTSLPGLLKAQSDEDLSGLSKYLPAVGVLIGLILVTVHFLCGALHANLLIRSFVLVLAWTCITGCIHLDGLMDTADGIFSHRSRERMLEIMRDSRVGNYGVISGIIIVMGKLIGLASLPANFSVPALLLIPAWARWAELVAIACFPYAREEGMGKIWHDSTRKRDLVYAAAVPGIASIATCFIFQSCTYSLLIPLTVIPGCIFAMRMNKLLNGQTGDTYGATVEVSETSALLALALLSNCL